MEKTEQEQLVELLSRLEPGFLPYEVFLQFARLTVLSILEFVPLRFVDGRVEVLLLERDVDDDLFVGEVHVPGTVIRPTDSSGEIYKAFERILKDELMGTEVSGPHFVGNLLHPSKRGMEQAQIFWIEVLGKPKTGVFYPANKLPGNLIDSQKGFILQAVENYENTRN